MFKTESDSPHKYADTGRVIRKLEALWMIVTASSTRIVGRMSGRGSVLAKTVEITIIPIIPVRYETEV